MSKKKITCLEYFKENIAEELFGFKTLQKAWNFCASQYENEIEELKVKFSESTKTYTDDIDRLEKENQELREYKFSYWLNR